MKKCLIVQPGGYGDIILCAPIAKWYYDKGYVVYWPARKKFKQLLSYFDYITYVELEDVVLDIDWLRSDVLQIIPMFNQFDLVLNLADRGPHLTAQLSTENFELCKYRIANVPFTEKQNLVWKRNLAKEQDLYANITNSIKGRDYALLHIKDSLRMTAEYPSNITLDKVFVDIIDGYEILDWYLVAINAKEIYCVESSIHQFLDGISKHITKFKFLLKRPIIPCGYRFTVSDGWKLDYIGINSIIKG